MYIVFLYIFNEVNGFDVVGGDRVLSPREVDKQVLTWLSASLVGVVENIDPSIETSKHIPSFHPLTAITI